MAAIHTEEQFEDEICEVLKVQGWLVDGPLPFQKGFAYDKGYDRRAALYPEDAIAWVKDTQSDAWEKFAKNHTKNPEAVFIERLVQELDKDRPTIKKETPQLWGSLYVLRKGFKDINATFKMAQFAPATSRTPPPGSTTRRTACAWCGSCITRCTTSCALISCCSSTACPWPPLS